MVIGGSMGEIKYISKGKLKAQMLEIFRQLEADQGELVVTDHNVPVLRIVPIKRKVPARKVFAKDRGKLKHSEPLESPTSDEFAL